MLVICLLFLLDRLIILKNAVCPVEIFLLHAILVSSSMVRMLRSCSAYASLSCLLID